MPSRFGPHIQHSTPAALAWAARAPIVKALDDPSPLASAHTDALLIFRAVMNDWSTQFAQPIGFFQTTMARLDSFRAKGRLFVELLNEVPPDHTAQYIRFAQQVVPLFHAAGLLVIGPNFATGDYNLDDWAAWRRADWANLDLIGVHAYWSLKGPTPWNGYRWRTYYDPTLDGRELVVTECGHDRVRDGDGGVYLGKGGWKQDGLTIEQAAAELNAYARSLLPHESAVAFTAGAYPSQSSYDLDSIAPLIVATPATPTKPPEKKPMPTDFTCPNHGGLRPVTAGCVVHATLGGTSSPQAEFTATVSWFQNPVSEVSAHAVVGPAHQVWRPVRPELEAWHCQASNARKRGLEMCKAYLGDQILPEILDDSAKVIADWWLADRAAGVLWLLEWDVENGLAEHHEMPTNTDGHADVGGPFDRADFLARVKAHAGQGDDLSNEQKKAVLDDLDFIYAYARVENITKNPAEAQKVIQERAIALKTTLGLNG